jgi:glutamate 5-kinase
MARGRDFRSELVRVHRVVVKIGSAVLTRADGLDMRRVQHLVDDMAFLIKAGREVVVVSSGAIASGFTKIGLSERPQTIQAKQACAAVGQPSLMLAYEKSFARHGLKVAQVLLTADDLAHRQRYLNARNTLTTLLAWGIVPIVNENDTVAVEEIKFGDNDTLAGMIVSLAEADVLIALTDIDGLYDRDPRRDAEARFVPMVKSVSRRIETQAGTIPGALGAGGMYTKVRAKRVARMGLPTIIANGTRKDVLKRILAGQEEGTLFLPQAERLPGRKHWIAFSSKPRGRIVVDGGAGQALLKGGKSLLPSGVVRVEGRFQAGDSVEVRGQRGRLVGIGLTNYSSEEMTRILGCQTCDIEERLGYKHSDEVIHRDNLVVAPDLEA